MTWYIVIGIIVILGIVYLFASRKKGSETTTEESGQINETETSFTDQGISEQKDSEESGNAGEDSLTQ